MFQKVLDRVGLSNKSAHTRMKMTEVPPGGVSDEPLGKSNTERRIKKSVGISKKACNNTFIVKFENFTTGVKI